MKGPKLLIFFALLAVVLAAFVGWRLYTAESSPSQMRRRLVDETGMPDAPRAEPAWVAHIAQVFRPKLDEALLPSERDTSDQFIQVLTSALETYQTGSRDAFTAMRRYQGFEPFGWWGDYAPPRSYLQWSVGILPERLSPTDATVTRRMNRGVPVDQTPRDERMLIQGMRMVTGELRGDHDIGDPVAEGADVIEVSFSTQVENGGRRGPCTLRIWLAKRPHDKRWLLNKWEFESRESLGIIQVPRS